MLPMSVSVKCFGNSVSDKHFRRVFPTCFQHVYMTSISVFPMSVSNECFLQVFLTSVSNECFRQVFPTSVFDKRF